MSAAGRAIALNDRRISARAHTHHGSVAVMAGLSWDHTENIALALQEKHPDVDPLTVRFTDLHKWITELPDFGDDPAKSTEGKLEAIQMAWYEEYKENL